MNKPRKFPKKEKSGILVSLSAEDQNNIFNRLKKSFRDCAYFDGIIASRLKMILEDSAVTYINSFTTKHLAERYFDTKLFNDSPNKRVVLVQIRLIFKCCYVLILSMDSSMKSLMWNTVTELLQGYPSLSTVSSKRELEHLLNFRNYMRLALEIVPASAHKQLLINIAGRLEGSDSVEFITGGGQKESVSRRVLIFETEGGVQPVCKAAKRPADVIQKAGSMVRKNEMHKYVPSKKLKALMQLSPEEVKRLTETNDGLLEKSNGLTYASEQGSMNGAQEEAKEHQFFDILEKDALDLVSEAIDWGLDGEVAEDNATDEEGPSFSVDLDVFDDFLDEAL
jgi:hypothetical protein